MAKQATASRHRCQVHSETFGMPTLAAGQPDLIEVLAFTPICLSGESFIQPSLGPEWAIVSVVPEILIDNVVSLATSLCDMLDTMAEPGRYAQLKERVRADPDEVYWSYGTDVDSETDFLVEPRILLSDAFCKRVADCIADGNALNRVDFGMEMTVADIELWYYSGGMECVARSTVGAAPELGYITERKIGHIRRAQMAEASFKCAPISDVRVSF